MRSRVLAAIVMVLVALGATRCGGSGTTVDPLAAKAVLLDIMAATVEDDFAKAAPSFDVADWMSSVGLADAPRYNTMSPEEQEVHQRTLFGRVRAVTSFTGLSTRGALQALIDPAPADVLAQTKVVYVTFTAPDAENPARSYTWKIKMRLWTDGRWRLAGIEEQ